MHYTDLTTDQSNEIHCPSFWCYFDPHENTTRMSNEMNNDPRFRNNAKRQTPVTIAPAKASLSNINRTIARRYREWESLQKVRKHCLKILEVIPEGEEKAYKFKEQQKAAAVEAERWEKEKSVERQQQVQEKYQRLKHN